MEPSVVIDDIYSDLMEFVGQSKLAMRDIGVLMNKLGKLPHWMLTQMP